MREDLDAPRKQRHTARRVLARLVDEHQLDVSYSSVRDYVARRRPEIAAEAGDSSQSSRRKRRKMMTTSSSSSSIHLHDRRAFVIVAADLLVTVSAVRAYG